MRTDPDEGASSAPKDEDSAREPHEVGPEGVPSADARPLDEPEPTAEDAPRGHRPPRPKHRMPPPMDLHFGICGMPDGDSAVYLVFSWLELESIDLWHRADVIEAMERYDRQYGRAGLLRERDRLRYEVEFMVGFKTDEESDPS